jgi:catechol 2,3-dioxygenase-like lactoylglutathione lyase family enzyme
MAISMVGTISVFVADQERAKAFYTEKLGMELRADAPLFPGSAARWIAVAPAGAQTEIVLYLPDENWAHYEAMVGQAQALTLSTSNVRATYEALKARGVEFTQEPEVQPWGTFVTLKDSEGNSLLLVQEQ